MTDHWVILHYAAGAFLFNLRMATAIYPEANDSCRIVLDYETEDSAANEIAVTDSFEYVKQRLEVV